MAEDSIDPVRSTIKTYDDTADYFYATHFDISSVKRQADYFIRNVQGKDVLDIGCGPGRDSKYFSEHGLSVTGIDLTQRFVDLARKNIPHGRFMLMDMRNLDFPERTFDGIWACASFLHIPKNEAKATLSGFVRVLKKSGLIYLSVKQGSTEEYVGKPEYNGRKKFFAFYTEAEFRALLESCGLRISEFMIEMKKDTWLNAFAKPI